MSIDRVPALGARAPYAKQAIHDTLCEYTQDSAEPGQGLSEVRYWKWGNKG